MANEDEPTRRMRRKKNLRMKTPYVIVHIGATTTKIDIISARDHRMVRMEMESEKKTLDIVCAILWIK